MTQRTHFKGKRVFYSRPIPMRHAEEIRKELEKHFGVHFSCYSLRGGCSFSPDLAKAKGDQIAGEKLARMLKQDESPINFFRISELTGLPLHQVIGGAYYLLVNHRLHKWDVNRAGYIAGISVKKTEA
jgi:hypothetical protein